MNQQDIWKIVSDGGRVTEKLTGYLIGFKDGDLYNFSTGESSYTGFTNPEQWELNSPPPTKGNEKLIVEDKRVGEIALPILLSLMTRADLTRDYAVQLSISTARLFILSLSAEEGR